MQPLTPAEAAQLAGKLRKAQAQAEMLYQLLADEGGDFCKSLQPSVASTSLELHTVAKRLEQTLEDRQPGAPRYKPEELKEIWRGTMDGDERLCLAPWGDLCIQVKGCRTYSDSEEWVHVTYGSSLWMGYMYEAVYSLAGLGDREPSGAMGPPQERS